MSTQQQKHGLVIFNIGSYPQHNDSFKVGMSFIRLDQMVFSAYSDPMNAVCMYKQAEPTRLTNLMPEVN